MTLSDTPALDIDHLRTWIGREEIGSDILGEDLARKYHAMFDMPGSPPRLGDRAPRLIHHCLTQPVVPTADLAADGHSPRGGFLPPVVLPRRMWAGGKLTFHGDLRVGDRVHRQSRIADVVLKHGTTGPLCFVTVQHIITVDGRRVLDERQDIVYRGADGGNAKPPAAAGRGVHRRPVDPSPTLLFRYSALTFNAHRIHYDRRYVTDVEHYPGLVVQGPMQAAWLLHYATELNGNPPSQFAFRGQSPLFDSDAITLNAGDIGPTLTLWTARDDGPVAMSAEASWA